jgi:putative component of toxin-antitoxin plasmid stabilization module
MPAMNIYRIYTEQKNKREIVSLAGKQFESFTLQPTQGYYKGKGEKEIVIEIIGAGKKSVQQLAKRIRKMNGQRSVLILSLCGQAKTTMRR